MANPIDTMVNPHREVKEIVSILCLNKKPIGFRVKTAEGVTGDIELEAVHIEVFKALKGTPTENLIAQGNSWVTKLEIDKGVSLPDLTQDETLVRSLQYIIYFLERKYKQENASNVFELSLQYRDNGKIKNISGYVVAMNERDAIGFSKAYLAQTKDLNPMEINCSYAEPFYEAVNWGPQSPLLAIKLTLAAKWNKIIVPKAKKKAAEEDRN